MMLSNQQKLIHNFLANNEMRSFCKFILYLCSVLLSILQHFFTQLESLLDLTQTFKCLVGQTGIW